MEFWITTSAERDRGIRELLILDRDVPAPGRQDHSET